MPDAAAPATMRRMDHVPLLIVAGFLAGAMNAIAGGGSFVTFPMLVFAGLPAVTANATSTVALFPGTIASTWAYRHDLGGIAGVRLRILLPISVAGGLLGAALLLFAPQAAFNEVIPWLLLLATLTFAGGRELGLALSRHLRIGPAVLIPVQFVIAIYGGYFGGAVGLMMLAVWSLLDTTDLKSMAGARTLLVSAANGAAVLFFAAAGAVRWREALAMLVFAVLGGYLGARIAQRVPAVLIRILVVLLSATVTVGFFLRAR
ncbi:MAG: sulfite exporter TauE/SafE family protein [Acetobacteraceae bacterium]